MTGVDWTEEGHGERKRLARSAVVILCISMIVSTILILVMTQGLHRERFVSVILLALLYACAIVAIVLVVRLAKRPLGQLGRSLFVVIETVFHFIVVIVVGVVFALIYVE